MQRILFFLVPALSLFVACNRMENREVENEKAESGLPFIFRMNLMYSEAENNISFPIWFDDEIISKNAIRHISRQIYHVSLNSDDDKEEEDLDLREWRDYFFSKNGSLDSMRIRYYFDDHEINNVAFSFPSSTDQLGFCKNVRMSNNLASSKGPDITYRLYNRVEGSKKFATYIDQRDGQKIHYLFNKKHWGPLSVDSILRPGKDDLIVLGSPTKPQKKYTVVNKVHENNVRRYDYFPKTKVIQTISRMEYPFDVKRSFLYDKNHQTIGYIDSTFSTQNFLTRTKSGFSFDKKGLPVELKRVKENQGNQTSLVSIEKYHYEVYP